MALSACDCAIKKPKRHKIYVEASNETTDILGGQANVWTSPTIVTTAKASIEPIRGGEIWKAQAVQSPVSHRITINYRSGIKHQHRIRFEDRGTTRLFNIKSILDIEERHKILEILAVENVPT